jgi:hypothetical protein
MPRALDLSLPGFEVRGEAGRGGMGVVYRAYQESMKREVALKVLPPVLAGSPVLLERFRKEASIAGRLVESHLLPVHEVMEAQGAPVLVMPFVDGGTLSRVVKDRLALRDGKEVKDPHALALLDDPAYLERILPVLDEVIQAVVALNGAGVLHRDIKPGNVLLDRKGEPWLTDFGLARVESDESITQPGTILGTPPYASPEQARGDVELDGRTDVFSLGVTLYQVLTLHLPFGRHGARHNPALPVLPSRRQPRLSRGYDAVLLKALEIDRDRRYRSTAELQADWRRVRTGQLPHAQSAGPLYRMAHRLRRNPGLALAGVLSALLAAVLGVGAAFWPREGTRPVPTRTVVLKTEPPGAEVVMVPLDPYSAELQPEHKIQPAGRTPLTISDVPIGDYLVVARVPGHGFHEVYRKVAETGAVYDSYGLTVPLDASLAEDRQPAADLPDGSLRLMTVRIPRDDAVTKGMARFPGGGFTMGTDKLQGVPPHEKHIDPFLLDDHEVTKGEFQKRCRPDQRAASVPGSHAITWVSYDQALQYAEMVGKRLPTGPEYEFAATGGGKSDFPWGDDATLIREWPVGPVGEPGYDRTPTNPPVAGLFSNVAEWTATGYVLYPGTHPGSVLQGSSQIFRDKMKDAREVRGAPPHAIEGVSEKENPDKKRLFFGTRARSFWSRDSRLPGVGFRCARSVQPRFLDR